jgi:hypothetical protein
MNRAYSLLVVGATLLFACSTAIPAPDVCAMPRNRQSWHGAQVTGTGEVIDTRIHGVFLDCGDGRRTVPLDWSDQMPDRDALDAAMMRALAEDKVLIISAEGRLGWAYGESLVDAIFSVDFPVFHVTRVRSIRLQPDSGDTR